MNGNFAIKSNSMSGFLKMLIVAISVKNIAFNYFL